MTDLRCRFFSERETRKDTHDLHDSVLSYGGDDAGDGENRGSRSCSRCFRSDRDYVRTAAESEHDKRQGFTKNVSVKYIKHGRGE